MRDNISLLEAYFLVDHKVVICLILAMYFVSLNVCLHVYSVKCYSQEGKLCRRPLYFFYKRRDLSSWQMCLAWQILVAGGSNVRKSSK